MRRCISVTLYAGLVSLVSFGTVSAETTGWFVGSEGVKVRKILSAPFITKNNIVIQKVECRDTGKIDYDLSDFEYRVTYSENKKGVEQIWALGAAYGPYRLEAERDGFKLVSYSSFVRKKSGIRFHCAIWHK